MTASCLYEGTVRHRRFAVRGREFSHRLEFAYVDLDELPRLLGGRLIASRPGLLRFRRRDYLGDRAVPHERSVRDAAEALTGRRPTGPIRLLTHLRTFGHCFNPVSFYVCMDDMGERPETVIAEVTNTPWGERRRYALEAGPDSRLLTGRFAKAMHVSPFMGMDHDYRARMTVPGDTVSVHIENWARPGHEPRPTHGGLASASPDAPGDLAFDVTLSLRRRPLSERSVARMLARYPFATLRVLLLIYGHAAALWLRRVPVHRHPGALPA